MIYREAVARSALLSDSKRRKVVSKTLVTFPQQKGPA